MQLGQPAKSGLSKILEVFLNPVLTGRAARTYKPLIERRRRLRGLQNFVFSGLRAMAQPGLKPGRKRASVAAMPA